MEIYDTEEEQVAAIKRWWKENGTSTITGVVVGVAMLSGWNLWQNHTKDKANQASAFYTQLQESVSKENIESAEKIAEKLETDFASTSYIDFASLQLAKIKVQQGDLDAAKVLLEKLMVGANSVELKHVARIRLIKVLQAKDLNEQGLQLIAEVNQASAEGFIGSYDELKGDLYVALDRLGEARTAYQSALRAGVQSPLLQFKLDDITPVEIVSNPVQLLAE